MRPASCDPLSRRRNVCGIAALLLLCACEASVAPVSANGAAPAQDRAAGVPVRPIAPVLEAKAPGYPPLAIYIVYREYVHQNPGLTTLSDDDPRYQQYMEKRLRELYPARGYAGMMRDAVAEARRNRLLVRQYERDVREYDRRMRALSTASTNSSSATSTCEASYADSNAGADSSWSGQEEFAVPPDEQLPTIQMEIDTLQLEGPEVDAIHYYEALATGTYAPGGGPGGGDTINMTGVEDGSTARVMDLHNNDIGRSVRYHAFRGHWLWDRWDWQEWAAKVRNYIDNPANAEYIPEWSVEPRPTVDQAWDREACVSDAKYIYFSIQPTS